MAVITHTFFSVLHYWDWLYFGGCSLLTMIFVLLYCHLATSKLCPFPFNRDMYSVYHVFIFKCFFRGLSRLSTNLSCHGRSKGMRQKLSGWPSDF